MSLSSFKCLSSYFLTCMVKSYLPILHYDATLFRSVNRRILKLAMISFNMRPFSSFLMMGVFFSFFRAFLNFIHQTISSYITDFNTRNKLLTQKLLQQGYWYHKLRKTFSKFYRRYYDLISKFQVGRKSLLRHGLSEPEFNGDLVYKLKKIVGS